MRAVASAARSYNSGAHSTRLPDDAGQPDDNTLLGIGPELFRAVMRHHANGVAVITAGVEMPVGFCATSLASVSLDPPLVSFTIGLQAASWPTVQTAPHVMVHLLADGQENVARRFARTGAAKFGAGTRWHRGARGLPVLDDVLAWLVLAPVSRLSVGDHALVIGQVIEARHTARPGAAGPPRRRVRAAGCPGTGSRRAGQGEGMPGRIGNGNGAGQTGLPA